ncbi:MAG: DEAD/DEAH box helicase [Deltaproteobacteria bacterium]|nr:DEAD/DEAH box helicase [Deltaproteobacteria bacterium]
MIRERKYQRRPTGSGAGKRFIRKGKAGLRRAPVRKSQYGKPKADPSLKPVFKKIGVPEPGPFIPDPFQLEALDLIEEHDLLVSAPTGSGKTWIASQAIRSYLERDLRVWYASPLKALSNSIYQEFCHDFGISHCGILTGDRKENPDAPIIVGTTEILRNQLYDAMHRGSSINADLVILDEAHYLSDSERGVVWEEVLIYLPPRVRLLMLSATVSNADEVCDWLREIRGVPNRVVLSRERPVPLEMLFLFPDGFIAPLSSKRGLNHRVRKFIASAHADARGRLSGKIDFGSLVECLRQFDLLPAIFFLKSRKDCDGAILTCPEVICGPEEKAHLEEAVRMFLKEYPHLRKHRQMAYLLRSRVASHHGGQLPYWKVLVEKIMSGGYLEAIFSTSTVAAGVNFPARTVVLVQSDRYNGQEFTDLTATELHQMVGRAGRRGKDHIGFAVIIPGVHQDPKLIHELTDSSPEPLKSQIHINFSMTLNLLLSHSPIEVKDLLERSFAAFQERLEGSSISELWDRTVSDLGRLIPDSKCDIKDPFQLMENMQKRSELLHELKSVNRKIPDPELREKAKGLISQRLKSIQCEGCRHFRVCHINKKGRFFHLLRELRMLSVHIEKITGGLWLSFKRHLRFLKETGFVDDMERLTPDGIWASRLRLDQPLLIAEAIRRGAMQGVSPEIIAGCIAPFVWDRAQEVEVNLKGRFDYFEIEKRFSVVLEHIEPLKALKARRGFDSPPVMFWPGAALFMWAKGVSWEELLDVMHVSEGDMASLIMRTADHLRQIAGLAETHPQLAYAAEEAIRGILREPVYI